MFIKTKPKSWKQARELAQELTAVAPLGWAFRGHPYKCWRLIPTLQRAAETYRYPPSDLPRREALILRHFQRRAHHHVPAPPAREERLQWLALVQHHGGPTRLLDFSYSFYVAAFFAVEQAVGDAAIWAVNLRQIEHPVSSRSRVGDTDTRHRAFAEEHLKEAAILSRKGVLNVQPERMNERITVQQGLFLFPCDLTSSFEDNLVATFRSDLQALRQLSKKKPSAVKASIADLGLIKIILPKEMHKRALDDLKAMNITSTTLFPGLDGFARSLHYQLRLKEQGQKSVVTKDG